MILPFDEKLFLYLCPCDKTYYENNITPEASEPKTRRILPVIFGFYSPSSYMCVRNSGL